jgi:hypothetical protein
LALFSGFRFHFSSFLPIKSKPSFGFKQDVRARFPFVDRALGAIEAHGRTELCADHGCGALMNDKYHLHISCLTSRLKVSKITAREADVTNVAMSPDQWLYANSHGLMICLLEKLLASMCAELT